MNTSPRENFDYDRIEDGQEILPGNVVELFPIQKRFWDTNEDPEEPMFELEEIGSINNIVNLDKKRKKGIFMAMPIINDNIIEQKDKQLILFFDCVDTKPVTVDENNKRQFKSVILKKSGVDPSKVKLIPNTEFESTERAIINECLKGNIINLFYSRELNQGTIEAMLKSIRENAANKESEEYKIYWTADNFNKNYDF